MFLYLVLSFSLLIRDENYFSCKMLRHLHISLICDTLYFVEDDSLCEMDSFNDELPVELAARALSEQNVFGDQSQDVVTQDHQLSEQLSASSVMPVLSSAAAPNSAGASLPQSSASAASHASATLVSNLAPVSVPGLASSIHPWIYIAALPDSHSDVLLTLA